MTTDLDRLPQQEQEHAEEFERILAKLKFQDQRLMSLKTEIASVEREQRNLDRQLLFVLTQTTFPSPES